MEKAEKNVESKSGNSFDAEHFKEGLAKQIKAAGGVHAFYAQGDFLKQLTKSAMEVMLEAEMDMHLGFEKNSSEAIATTNRRNGKDRKTVRGDFGELEIATPRDRESSFEPLIVEKGKSSVGKFTDKVLSLYTRGMTTRDIEDHLREMYEVDVSPQFISRCVERIHEDVTEWQNRPLKPLYPVVYVDGLWVSARSGDNKGPVTKKCVYVVLGVSTAGQQEVLGLWVQDTEGARFWLKVLNDLKSRGVTDILLLCGDGLKGLPEAVAAGYPETDVQLCVVHQIRNATRFVPYQDKKAFCRDMKPIYGAPSVDAAERALLEFKEKWGKRYPASVESWRRNWSLLTMFFKYPPEMRKDRDQIVARFATTVLDNAEPLLERAPIFPESNGGVTFTLMTLSHSQVLWCPDELLGNDALLSSVFFSATRLLSSLSQTYLHTIH